MYNIKQVIKFKRIGQKIKSAPYSFITWISYFSTLLVSSFIIIILLNINYERTTINIISSLNDELAKYSQKTSLQIDDMIKTYSCHTFYTPDVLKLRESSHLSNFEVISAIRSLDCLVSTNKYVHSVYIYNSNSGYIYTTLESGSDNLDNFLDKGAVKIFQEGVQDNIEYPLYREIKSKSCDKVEGVYSFVLYASKNGIDYDNALMVNLYSNEYDNSFFGNNYKEEMMIDKDHRKIIVHSEVNNKFSFNEGNSFADKIINCNEDNGYIIEGNGRNKMIYLYSYMNEHQRYFVRYMKYDDCMDNISVIKELSMLIILIIFVSGVVISLIMLTRIYLPLKKILHTIAGGGDDTTYRDKESILKNLDFWVQNREENQQAYLSTVKEEFLKQLLVSPVPPVKSIEQNFTKYEVNLKVELPIVLIITKGFSLHDGIEKIKSIASIYAEVVEIASYTVFFVQSNSIETVETICNELIDSGANFCGHSIPIEDYHELNRSFNRIREVYAFRVFYPEASFLSETILDEKSKENIYPDVEEGKIILSLRNGKYKNAVDQYYRWLEAMSMYRYNVISFAFKRLYLSISTLYQQMSTCTGSHLYSDGIEFIEDKLNEIEDISEVNNLFFLLFEKICDLVNQKKISKNNQLVDEIKALIKQEYTNPNLSSQTFADKFELSNTYVGKLFRSIENCSISSYINNVRIEQAKIQLLNSERTVNDIAASVGFDNISYFYTLFKNYTGMSPAAYRESGEKFRLQ